LCSPGWAAAGLGQLGSPLRRRAAAALAQVVNVTPRYAKLKGRADTREVIGWENIELISDRPLETMLNEFRRLKQEFPGRILIASIMEARPP